MVVARVTRAEGDLEPLYRYDPVRHSLGAQLTERLFERAWAGNQYHLDLARL